MKLYLPNKKNQQGSALVGAILVVGVASVGFAMWTSLLNQRTASTETYRGVMDRQLSLSSSQQVVRNYLNFKAVTASSGGLANSGSTPPNNELQSPHGASQGGALVTNWSGAPMDSVDTWIKEFNPFAPGATEKPFSKVFSAQARFAVKRNFPTETLVGNNAKSVVGAVQSRSPLMGSYQLVLHTPSYTAPYTVTGNITVNGGLLAFPVDGSYLNIKARLRHLGELPPGFTAGAVGSAYVPSNLPIPTFSSGKIAGAPDFTGKLDVISASGNGGNSVEQRLAHVGPIRIVRFDGNTPPVMTGVTLNAGILNVDLNSVYLEHMVVTNHLSEINITGNGDLTADSRRAIALIYLQDSATTRDLTKITFNGVKNDRRLLLCLRKNPAVNTNGTNVNFAFPDSLTLPTWRSAIILERTPVTFQATGGTGTITIKGGIQTNAALAFPATPSGVLIKRENQGLYLDRYCPRLAWVEQQTQ